MCGGEYDLPFYAINFVFFIFLMVYTIPHYLKEL